MNIVRIAKEKMIINYFVVKMTKKLILFFIPISFVLGLIFILTTFVFSMVNILILFLSSLGFACLISYIISLIIINEKVSTISGKDTYIIYREMKNKLEKMEEKKDELEKECSFVPLMFPAHLTDKDPRKELAKAMIKICLIKTELNLFDY